MPPAGHAPVRGVLAAFLAYLAWGLLPLYWHQLASVDAVELIAHRLCWTTLLTVPLWRLLDGRRPDAAAIRTHAVSAVLLAANWLCFVWAVNNGHVIESSLGYFLVPLVNVLLGRTLLREHLRRGQWLAIAFAAAGVALQLWQLGRLPWIALVIALTFGFYGLLRKRSPLGPLSGLALETTLLAPIAAAFLLAQAWHGAGALGHAPAATKWLVLSTGVVTAIPLLLFADGARRLRLVTLGLLQYVAPTAQFALGIWFFQESFPASRAQSFALIWTGLALYTFDAWRAARRAAVSSGRSRPLPS